MEKEGKGRGGMGARGKELLTPLPLPTEQLLVPCRLLGLVATAGELPLAFPSSSASSSSSSARENYMITMVPERETRHEGHQNKHSKCR